MRSSSVSLRSSTGFHPRLLPASIARSQIGSASRTGEIFSGPPHPRVEVAPNGLSSISR